MRIGWIVSYDEQTHRGKISDENDQEIGFNMGNESNERYLINDLVQFEILWSEDGLTATKMVNLKQIVKISC